MLIINIPEDEYNDIKNNIRISVPNIINYVKNGKLIPDDYCSKAERKEDQKFGKWIPVSKRLPEEGRTVIASTNYGVYPETRYTKEYGWEWAYEAGADYWRELKGVTAWMPLPKRYEPQAEKEEK